MHASTDRDLVQIVDAAVADAARRSGSWLLCKPGCNQCCTGVFAISALDARRLNEGLNKLDPERADRVRARGADSWARLRKYYPGDRFSGVLTEGDPDFDDFANDEVCPALDPETGMCDLYESRPLLCRTFGPPVAFGDGVAVCELCFEGAAEEEVARCKVDLDIDSLEGPLLPHPERTIVAFALAG